ncbi:MAG: gamma carbonic anhydrase family protein, partial [Deltaproteobacteria bacterium]|nr:gamma carbonic anhydrase family protein [Deltaproteobacteria bacterium]
MIIPFRGITPVLGRNVYIAPTAVIIGDVRIGDDSSIWFG